MEKSKKENLFKSGGIIVFSYVIVFIIVVFSMAISHMFTSRSLYKIEKKIDHQINNSNNNSAIFFNEYGDCLDSIITYRPLSKKFSIIDIEKFDNNQEYIYNFCLSYQMKKHLKNDASRYDFLEKKINEKGLIFHLKNEKFDYSKIF